MNEIEVKEITKKDKLKLSVLLEPNFIPSLNELIAKDLPAKISYWVSRSVNKVNAHIKEYNDVRMKALAKHCELDAKGGIVLVKGTEEAKFKDEASRAAWLAEIKDLQSVEVDVLKLSHEVLIESDVEVKPWVWSGIDELMY